MLTIGVCFQGFIQDCIINSNKTEIVIWLGVIIKCNMHQLVVKNTYKPHVVNKRELKAPCLLLFYSEILQYFYYFFKIYFIIIDMLKNSK